MVFAYTFVASLLRNLAGWIENSFEDYDPKDGWKLWKCIQNYEWAQLGGTTVRIFILTLAA